MLDIDHATSRALHVSWDEWVVRRRFLIGQEMKNLGNFDCLGIL
jgi:hypothetical protein